MLLTSNRWQKVEGKEGRKRGLYQTSWRMGVKVEEPPQIASATRV